MFLIGLKSDEKRLQIGKACGADYVLYSEDGPEKAVMEITGGKGAEFVLECSASQEGVQHAIDCARKAYEGPGGKGVVVFISLWGRKITLNLDEISLGQLDIRGSWSWNGQETWEHAIDLLDRGVFDLDPMITNHYEPGRVGDGLCQPAGQAGCQGARPSQRARLGRVTTGQQE